MTSCRRACDRREWRIFGLVPWKKDNGGSLAIRRDHPLSLFRDEFDTLFDRFFGNGPGLDTWSGWGLETDETDKDLTVKMDAPGFEPGEFDIQVSGDALRVTAERKGGKGNGGYERRFQRSLTLPAAVDAEKVRATYKNGVLELNLPKIERAQWKKVTVQGG
jgi:HSP20 family protein